MDAPGNAIAGAARAAGIDRQLGRELTGRLEAIQSSRGRQRRPPLADPRGADEHQRRRQRFAEDGAGQKAEEAAVPDDVSEAHDETVSRAFGDNDIGESHSSSVASSSKCASSAMTPSV